MNIYENLGKSEKIYEIYLWKSMKIYGNLWKSMEIYRNLWKSVENVKMLKNHWFLKQKMCYEILRRGVEGGSGRGRGGVGEGSRNFCWREAALGRPLSRKEHITNDIAPDLTRHRPKAWRISFDFHGFCFIFKDVRSFLFFSWFRFSRLRRFLCKV